MTGARMITGTRRLCARTSALAGLIRIAGQGERAPAGRAIGKMTPGERMIGNHATGKMVLRERRSVGVIGKTPRHDRLHGAARSDGEKVWPRVAPAYGGT